MEIADAGVSRPDLAGLLTPTPASVAPLMEDLERIRKRLARNDDDYDAGYIDGPRYKAARDKGQEELTRAQTALAAAQSGTALVGVLATPDPAKAFLNAPLAVQRAVIDTLAVVALAKGQRWSRDFDPSTVKVEWRS